MPRPHRKARRIVRVDDEEDEDVQLIDDTESEDEKEVHEEQDIIEVNDDTQMDIDIDEDSQDDDKEDIEERNDFIKKQKRPVEVDESFESALETELDESRRADTDIDIDEEEEQMNETADQTRRDSEVSSTASNGDLDESRAKIEELTIDKDRASNSEQSSKYGTPPAQNILDGLDLGDDEAQSSINNDHGIEVAHIRPLSALSDLSSVAMSPSKEPPQNSQSAQSFDEPTKQDRPSSSRLTNDRSVRSTTPQPTPSLVPSDVPELGPPPRTPERKVVDFSNDRHLINSSSKDEVMETDHHTHPGNQSFGPDDVINLVTISPSKGRLRALEAEKAASQADKPKDPRLVISRLVLTNFKSYAGKQEIGPFDSVSFHSNDTTHHFFILFQ